MEELTPELEPEVAKDELAPIPVDGLLDDDPEEPNPPVLVLP